MNRDGQTERGVAQIDKVSTFLRFDGQAEETAQFSPAVLQTFV